MTLPDYVHPDDEGFDLKMKAALEKILGLTNRNLQFR